MWHENKSREFPWWLSKHASISKVKNIPHCLKEKHNVLSGRRKWNIVCSFLYGEKEKNRRTWVLCDYCFRVGMSTRWRAAGYRGIQKKNKINKSVIFSRCKLSEPRVLSSSSPHSLAAGHRLVTWGFPARLVVDACLSLLGERENKLFLLSLSRSERDGALGKRVVGSRNFKTKVVLVFCFLEFVHISKQRSLGLEIYFVFYRRIWVM